MDLLPSHDNEVALARKDTELLGKGDKELHYLPSSRADKKMIEECAEVDPLPSGKQMAVDYASESYHFIFSLSLATQAIVKSSNMAKRMMTN